MNDELVGWVRLGTTPGLGRGAARRLLAAFGSPQAVLDASAAALGQFVDAASARALAQSPAPQQQTLLDAAAAWLAADASRRIVTLGDAAYPPLLLHTEDPPLLLYTAGVVGLLRAPSLAVVGSRNASRQGAENARAFACALSAAGWTVVSGLALGIDGAAHEGALDGMRGGADGRADGCIRGSTIAVIGTGIDRIYPARHEALARRIAAQGLIVSEFPLGMPPLAENFPRRNRLIAGLSRGTLVVEAALRSGSLITARLAAEAGREVFAIPGSIHAPQSRGCHALIKQGAKLVEAVDDILGELGAMPSAPAPGVVAEDDDSVDDDAVLLALGHDPATLDALIARCGWPAPALSARLLELELEGRVQRLPGGLFQRIAAG